jgi:hypothetical protein
VDDFGSSGSFDIDSGSLITASIQLVNDKTNGVRVARRGKAKETRYPRVYIYIQPTLYKLCGSCPRCEGLAVGHARKRGVLRRGTIHCPCGWFGYGRDLEEQQWFTTTIQ